MLDPTVNSFILQPTDPHDPFEDPKEYVAEVSIRVSARKESEPIFDYVQSNFWVHHFENMQTKELTHQCHTVGLKGSSSRNFMVKKLVMYYTARVSGSSIKQTTQQKEKDNG